MLEAQQDEALATAIRAMHSTQHQEMLRASQSPVRGPRGEDWYRNCVSDEILWWRLQDDVGTGQRMMSDVLSTNWERLREDVQLGRISEPGMLPNRSWLEGQDYLMCSLCYSYMTWFAYCLHCDRTMCRCCIVESPCEGNPMCKVCVSLSVEARTPA